MLNVVRSRIIVCTTRPAVPCTVNTRHARLVPRLVPCRATRSQAHNTRTHKNGIMLVATGTAMALAVRGARDCRAPSHFGSTNGGGRLQKSQRALRNGVSVTGSGRA